MGYIRLFLKPLAGICAVLAVVLWYQAGKVATCPRDFVAFQAAGTILWDAPDKLYDQNEQLRVQYSLGLEDGFFPFPYPAVVALLFLPSRFLSVQAFFVVFLLCNLILLFTAMALVIRRLNLDAKGAETLLLVASTSFPVYFNLVAGQLGLLSLLFYLLFVSHLLKDRPTAGYWVGALAFKPTLLVIPAILLLWRRKWAALERAALVSGALALLSFVLVGWNGTRQHLLLLKAMGTDPLALGNVPVMPNLRALSHYLNLGDVGWMAGSALVILGLAVASRKERLEKWSITAFLLASVLVPPHLHVYDLAILLIAPALGFPTSNWYQRFYVLLGLLPLIVYAPTGTAIPLTPAVFFVLFWFAVYRARRRPERAGHGSVTNAEQTAVAEADQLMR